MKGRLSARLLQEVHGLLPTLGVSAKDGQARPGLGQPAGNAQVDATRPPRDEGVLSGEKLRLEGATHAFLRRQTSSYGQLQSVSSGSGYTYGSPR